MKVISKFTLKAFVSPFVISFLVILFILLMQFVWKYVDDLVGKGLEWYIIAELLVYTSASLVPLALPLAVLLASIMTFGRMGENYELVAFKSSGVSLFRIMRPLLVAMFFMSIGAFLFSNYVIPYSNLKSGALLWDITRSKPAFNLRTGVFYNGIEGYSIKVANKSGENGNLLEDVMIYDHTANRGNVKVISAESGKMIMNEDDNIMTLELYNGFSYEEMNPENRQKRKNYPLLRSHFSKEIIRFDLSNFKMKRTDEGLFKNNYKMLNLAQLTHSIDSLDGQLNTETSDFKERLNSRYDYQPPARTEEGAVSSKHKLEAQPEQIDSVPGQYLLENYELPEQQRIIQTATVSARNAKAYVYSYIGEFKNKNRWIVKHKLETHKKFTLSFAVLILFLVGAPLGSIIRKGGMGLPVVVAILIFLFYHIVSTTTEKLGRDFVLTPFGAMWLSSMILLPFGLWLTYKSTTDSALFNSERYWQPIERLFKKLFTRKKRHADMSADA
ncbi:MAG: LptF/LptG family permease [Flavobacteriales bacterium]|nr:LptF/LptG family permease [Flavobacteriales bacterium]